MPERNPDTIVQRYIKNDKSARIYGEHYGCAGLLVGRGADRLRQNRTEKRAYELAEQFKEEIGKLLHDRLHHESKLDFDITPYFIPPDTFYEYKLGKDPPTPRELELSEL